MGGKKLLLTKVVVFSDLLLSLIPLFILFSFLMFYTKFHSTHQMFWFVLISSCGQGSH